MKILCDSQVALASIRPRLYDGERGSNETAMLKVLCRLGNNTTRRAALDLRFEHTEFASLWREQCVAFDALAGRIGAAYDSIATLTDAEFVSTCKMDIALKIFDKILRAMRFNLDARDANGAERFAAFAAKSNANQFKFIRNFLFQG